MSRMRKIIAREVKGYNNTVIQEVMGQSVSADRNREALSVGPLVHGQAGYPS